MSVLPTSLAKQFVKETNDTEQTEKQTQFYGTASVQSDGIYVVLDGSTFATPVSMATDAETGDRVLVEIVDHKARILQTVDKSSSEYAVDAVENKIINADTGVFQQLRVGTEYVNTLIASDVTADSIVAQDAEIKDLKANSLTVDDLDADTGKIGTLISKKADIDFANVLALEASEAVIQKLLVGGGIMTDDITSVTGEFTKYLTGVNISGDLINAGTISTERLIIYDPDSDKSILFAINDIGEVDQSTLSAEELKRLTLDGKLITAGTITADKIAVTDLSAFNATIGGFYINSTQIKSANSKIVLNSDGSFLLGGSDKGIAYDPETDTFSIGADTVLEWGGAAQKTLGESLMSTEIKYALSTSSTEFTAAEGSEWSTTMPTRETGTYIWQRTISTYANGTVENSDVCIQGAQGDKGDSGEDAILLNIISSNGVVFKNNNVSTVLNAVLYYGTERITTKTELEASIPGAYLQWSFSRQNEDTYYQIGSTDVRLSNDGFSLTISPDDVDATATYICELVKSDTDGS